MENIRFLPAKNVNRDDDMNYMVVTKEETIGPAELHRPSPRQMNELARIIHPFEV